MGRKMGLAGREGTFRFPAAKEDGQGLEIRAADLTMLLDGVDLGSVKRQKRYRRPQPQP